jgi:MFS family permease
MNSDMTTQPSRRTWQTLAILLIGSFMALLDVTIVNVALPSIQHGIHTGNSTLEWVVSGYALALGLALIPAGRIGDNIGHRKTFLIGLVVFTLASLSCSLAHNAAEITASRLVQGFGAGIYTPAITSFIQILFSGKARSKAFSIFGAIIGLSTALGPLIGGLLVQAGGASLGWRLVFLVNVPIGIVLFPLAYKMLPRDSEVTKRHQVDPTGIGLLSTGLLLLLIPLVEGQEQGWPLWTYICLVLAIPVFYGLWVWENRLERIGKEPLLATHLLRESSFAAGSLLALVYFASFTSIFFTLSSNGAGNRTLCTRQYDFRFSKRQSICSNWALGTCHWLQPVGHWITAITACPASWWSNNWRLVTGTSSFHWGHRKRLIYCSQPRLYFGERTTSGRWFGIRHACHRTTRW